MSRRQYGACALHAEYPRLKAHTIWNTYCFSIATIVPRTRLVTLHVHCFV
jgi:hypothetical protein